VPVPAGTKNGHVVVTVDGVASNGALFTVPGTFTDDPIVAGTTVIKAVHVTELRSRIDAIRAAKGLAAYAWNDPSLPGGAMLIRAQHILDLRAALTGAYVAAGLPPPLYTDPTFASGASVKAAHITEIRSAILAIEQP
jgi:hypothetical protein